MDSTEMTIYVVLLAAGTYAAGRFLSGRGERWLAVRERGGRPAGAGEGGAERLSEAEGHWTGLIHELLGSLEREGRFPQVPADQARRYRTFVVLRDAARIAKEDGRERVTPRDAEVAAARCDERVEAARGLLPSLRRAHELWAADILAVGLAGGPAALQVHALTDQMEGLALDGGDLNLYLWAAAARVHKARVITRATAARTGLSSGPTQARAWGRGPPAGLRSPC